MRKSSIAIMFCIWLLTGCAAPVSNPPAAIMTDSGANIGATNQLGSKSPFHTYDSALCEAVEKRWDDLLASQKFQVDRVGKVTVQFRLCSDGTVSDIKILDSDMGALLGYICKRSIQDSAPFRSWSPDMVRKVGEDHREFTFTFYYTVK